jgi:hypothetical protein
MNHRIRIGAAAIFVAVLSGVAFAEADDDAPIKATVCELAKQPARFDGKMVQVRGRILTGFEKNFLIDDSCDARIWFSWRHGTYTSSEYEGVVAYAFIKSPSELKHPERLKWKPVQQPRPVALRQDEAYKALDRYVTEFYGPETTNEVWCPPTACPAYSVSATVTGRFDYSPHKLRAARGKNPGELATTTGGFGHLNFFESQFVLQSIADVAATPIDRSFYRKEK